MCGDWSPPPANINKNKLNLFAHPSVGVFSAFFRLPTGSACVCVGSPSLCALFASAPGGAEFPAPGARSPLVGHTLGPEVIPRPNNEYPVFCGHLRCVAAAIGWALTRHRRRALPLYGRLLPWLRWCCQVRTNTPPAALYNMDRRALARFLPVLCSSRPRCSLFGRPSFGCAPFGMLCCLGGFGRP